MKLNILELVNPKNVDLSSFKLKDTLSHDIWGEDLELNEEIRSELLEIAMDYHEYLDIDWVPVRDVIITGSIANYNWSKFSDIDLHIVINYDEIDENIEFVTNYLKLKKDEWNEFHDITIKGFDIELYAQDGDSSDFITGIYSLMKDEWLIKPKPLDVVIDEKKISHKAANLMDKIDILQKAYKKKKYDKVIAGGNKLWDKIKKMRSSGLEKGGEFSVENLTFKVLRRNDYLDKLTLLIRDAYDDKHTIKQ